MTFAQAECLWENSRTVANGILRVTLSRHVRLIREDKDSFIIRAGPFDVVRITRALGPVRLVDREALNFAWFQAQRYTRTPRENQSHAEN